MVTFLRALVCALLTVAAFVAAAPRAAAAPVPAPYSESAVGDVAAIDLDLDGSSFTDVRLANAEALTDSEATPRSAASSRNLAAPVDGLDIAVQENSQTAPPDNAGAVEGGIGADAGDGITVEALSTRNRARWLGDDTCPGEITLGSSRVITDGVNISSANVTDLFDTGRSEMYAETTVFEDTLYSRGLNSYTYGIVRDVSLFGGQVEIEVPGYPVLGVAANGKEGGATVDYFNRPVVSVTANGQTEQVTVGNSTIVDLGNTGEVTVRVNEPTSTLAPNGRSAEASVSVVTLDVRVGPAGNPDGTANIDLLPMSARTVVPEGGLDCPPPAPTVTAPADDSTTADPTPTFSGTGVASSVIDLEIDGVVRQDVATVDGNGSWSYTLPRPRLTNGSHTVLAVQTLNGAASVASAESDFVVDAEDEVPIAPVISDPAEGSFTDDRTPTISGTGEAGATVTVEIDGDEVGQIEVDGNGTWSLTVTDPLSDGEHTVSAVQVDAADNVSPADESAFVVDTEAEPPVISSPDDGSSTSDTTPIVAGTAEPGASVAVSIDGGPVGTVTVDTEGRWSLQLTASLTQGGHTVSAVQTDRANNVSDPSQAAFTVDSQSPTAPVITAPSNGARTSDATPTITGTGEPAATVTVEVDGDEVGEAEVAGNGTWSVTPTEPLDDGRRTATAVQRDGTGNVSPSAEVTFLVDTQIRPPVITAPEDGSTTVDATPDVTGTAEPGAAVEVSVDGAVLGTVTADDDGGWSRRLTAPLTEGDHTVSAVQTDRAGNRSGRVTVEFAVDTQVPAAPVIKVPADRSVVRDSTPVIRGTGEAGTTVTVEVDGDQAGQVEGARVEVGRVEVAADGTWSLTLTDRLQDGPYTVSAVQTDRAGNVSPADEASFLVDAGVRPPAVSSPEDGSSTSDPTPTVLGTAERGATLEVAVDDVVVGTVTAGADGRWELVLAAPLSDGVHVLSVVQRDAAGNVSDPTEVEFVVDTRAPAAPVITSPANGEEVSDRTPTITGTGEPGTTVTVFVDGVPVGRVEVGKDGRWSLTLDRPLPNGNYTITAVAVDDAGNESGVTDVELEIDTPAAGDVLDPADGPQLADTGGLGLGYLVAGGVLLAVGGALLSRTRRRA